MSRPRFEIDDLEYMFSFTDEEKRHLKKLMTRDGVGLNGALEKIFREYFVMFVEHGEESSLFCANFEYDHERDAFCDHVCGDYIEIGLTSNGNGWYLNVWRNQEESKTREPFYMRDGFEELRNAYKHVDFYMGSYRSEAGIEED